MPEPRFYTVGEVAELFHKNKGFAYRHSRPGGFLHPFARKFGEKSLLFHRESLDRFIDETPSIPLDSPSE